MLPDDVYRRSFDAARDQLVAFARHVADAADVEQEATDDFVRIRLRPHAATACPVEVILHRQNQAYDIQFGAGDSYEGVRTGGDLTPLVSLLDAVVEGRLVTRAFCRAATAQPIASGVIVAPAVGLPISFGETDERRLGDDVIRRERHWAPYRRAAI